MRIVALATSPDHVCARYRVAAFRPYLEAAGHQLQLQSFPKGWWTPWSFGPDVAAADAVIVQRRLLSAWELFLLRRAARRLIFDFDDAIFLRDSYHPRGVHSSRRLGRFRATVRAADAVVAGNDWLADQACRWTKPDRVHVIPTCVNPREYALSSHDTSIGAIRFVWIGSASTLQGIERIQPILDQLGALHPNLRLQLICDQPLRLHCLPVDFRPWSSATEASDLAAADIGISWLPDDDWSRGKCGLKTLQYMAAGLPVITNPVGVQRAMVEPGVTGYWAETPAEWIDAVGRLVREAALRRQFGMAGRCVVEERYAVEHGAAQWLRVLEQAAAPVSIPCRNSA